MGEIGGGVCEINQNSRNPAKEIPNKEFLYIDITSVEGGTGEIKEIKKILGENAPSRARRVIHQDDVIMSTVRPYLKAFAVIPPEYDNQICSTGFAVLSCNSGILPKFLLYALFSEVVIEQCNKMMIGAHYPALNNEQVSEIKIPLPPLPEQKRIVARIEALFSKIDEIKRLRKEANDLAKTLMPSALHEVFSKADEKGWKWVRLGEIAFMRKQVTRPKGYPNEEFELYSIPAYHKTGYPEIRKGFEIGSSKFLVKSQDVLFGKLNPHIPKVWIVKNQTGKRQIATTEFFPIYAKNGNELLSKYLYWSLRDLRFLDSVLKLVIGTTGSRKRLQKGDFLNLEIPLPPLEEQKRIIAYLDTIQQKAQTLQKLQTETEMEIERLRESILHKAFRGEL